MKKHSFKFFQPVLFIIISITLCFTACLPETIVDNSEEAPELIPESEFLIDFKSFIDGKGKTAVNTDIEGVGSFQLAALTVGASQLWATVVTLLPIAAYVEAFKHQPVRSDDGVWTWAYSFKSAGIAHDAKLTGTVVGDNIEWVMFMTKGNEYQNYVWFEGLIKKDGSSGTWTLHNVPSKNTPAIALSFDNINDGKGYIKYENIIPNDSNNGGFIEYRFDNSQNFDSIFEINLPSSKEETLIEWSKNGKLGRVQSLKLFKDDLWHCWDTNFKDTDC